MGTKIFNSRLTLAMSKQEKLRKPVEEFLAARDMIIAKDEQGDLLRDKRGDIPDIRLAFVRAADALLLINRGVVNTAIIGTDVMLENTTGQNARYKRPDMITDLGLAKCSLRVAVRGDEEDNYIVPQDLEGKNIATSYPNILRSWLEENGVTPGEIVVRDGDVESSVDQGLADVVVDIVDTGSTLRKYKLVPVFDEVVRSSAALYAKPDRDIITNLLLDELVRRLDRRRELVSASIPAFVAA